MPWNLKNVEIPHDENPHDEDDEVEWEGRALDLAKRTKESTKAART